MKKRIFWGIIFIAFAVLLILDCFGLAFNIFDKIPLWKIFIGVVLLYWIVLQISKVNFYMVFFPIAFIVMIFEGEIATLLKIPSGDIAPWYIFLLIAFLLSVGFGFLFKKGGVKVTINNNDSEKGVNVDLNGLNYTTGKVGGKSTVYVDCSVRVNEKVENDLGHCDVFFTNIDSYDGNGKIEIENNLGHVEIHVPPEWVVSCKIDNNLGSVSAPKPRDKSGEEELKTLYITGDNNLGSVEIIID